MNLVGSSPHMTQGDIYMNIKRIKVFSDRSQGVKLLYLKCLCRHKMVLNFLEESTM
jgi:hypothetical protein